ncbi:MAG: CoB--CoM heterodisulfide reductase iron-sulfur subunit B family protein [Coriobacteriales bacterium]|nr:CoB--CoM heterodisulfide reductase iron-sulfur subunit B family protein [Coriobacteriales bacterium]
MTELKYSWFPGCSAGSTGIAYTQSAKYVADKIGLEMKEIDDWCCCGTSAARITDDDLMHALPARSLALSERQYPGLDIVAPCTGCYSALKGARHWARQSEENRRHVSELIDMDYAAEADVKSLLEIMVEPDVVDLTVSRLQKTLGGMKIACYYGCTQVRPAEVCNFDDVENPTSMERLLDACGAECVQWGFKTECCGASNHVVKPKAARKAVERIFRNAKACGAEAIVTSCPLCWLNLDMREQQINSEMGTDYHLPVYYFTELLAMAMGATPDEAGLGYHFEPAAQLAQERIVADTKAEEVAR